jgi:RNA polymerase sigma factor (sigma-70 family)
MSFSEAPARDIMDVYMADVRKLPRLNKAQLEELHRLREAGDARAQQALWLEALRLVVYSAGKLMGARGYSADPDTIQEGNIAAGAAVKTWNPAKGRFSTWIVKSVRGAMIDHYLRELRQGTGGKDAPLPYMIQLDASAGVIDEFAASDIPGEESPDASPLYDTVANEWLESPECAAQRAELRKHVHTIRDDTTRTVLLRYYGLDGDVGMTLSEIARSLGASIGFVHKQLSVGHQRMREKLASTSRDLF